MQEPTQLTVPGVGAPRQQEAGEPSRRRITLDTLGPLASLSPALVVIALFLAPLGIIFLYSFWTNGVAIGPPWTLDNYGRLFESPVYVRLMLRSLRLAVLVVLASVVLAFPIAYVVARVVPRRWQFLVLAAIMIPSLSSFLVRTYAFIIILNERGPINATLARMGLIEAPLPLLYNETAVFIGLLNVYLPWMVLPIYASMHKIDPSLYEAAENLGASRFAIWRHLVIPMSLPGVVAGCFLSFIPAVGSYATSLILGGSDAILFANTINAQFGEANNWPFGAALSVVLLLVILVFVALYQRFGRVERMWEA